MPSHIRYKIPQEFPVYKRLEHLAAVSHSESVVDWWHRTVRDRLVETLWSIINGKLEAERVDAVSLQDAFTWSRTLYPASFWEAVWCRIQRGLVDHGGEANWD